MEIDRGGQSLRVVSGSIDFLLRHTPQDEGRSFSRIPLLTRRLSITVLLVVSDGEIDDLWLYVWENNYEVEGILLMLTYEGILF